MHATVSEPLPVLRPARQPFPENLISTAIRRESARIRNYRSRGNAIIQRSRVSGSGSSGMKKDARRAEGEETRFPNVLFLLFFLFIFFSQVLHFIRSSSVMLAFNCRGNSSFNGKAMILRT